VKVVVVDVVVAVFVAVKVVVVVAVLQDGRRRCPHIAR
jgi:hypothetical protein